MNLDKKKLAEELLELVRRGALILYYEAEDQARLDEDQLKKIKAVKGYESFRKESLPIQHSYQPWFTLSSRVVKQVLPERHEEFCSLYRPAKRITQNIDSTNFTISDYLNGTVPTRGGKPRFDTFGCFYIKFETQKAILNSCIHVLDSKLSDIEGVLQYEIFENELEAASDLLKKKYLRAAGAIAGITLEVHLSKVCKNHGLKFKSSNPTISKFNEALKNATLVDTPTWRLIARLGDIRNMSVHSKDREPNESEIDDLIRGCKKLISELN